MIDKTALDRWTNQWVALVEDPDASEEEAVMRALTRLGVNSAHFQTWAKRAAEDFVEGYAPAFRARFNREPTLEEAMFHGTVASFGVAIMAARWDVLGQLHTELEAAGGLTPRTHQIIARLMRY